MTVVRPGLARPVRMGGFVSRTRRSRLRRKWSWSGAPGDHSPYPLDCVPYPGDDLLYCFLDIFTSYKVIDNDVNLGPRGVTTDTTQYLSELKCCYEEGFVLNQFVRVPGLRSTTVLQDWGEKVPYQAILSRKVTRDQTDTEVWDLHVEKQILSIKTLATDEFPQEHDLLQTIAEFAAKGARLVCAVPIGFVRSDSPNNQYTVMGVDLFFNIPRIHLGNIYAYHAIRLPIRYYVVPDVTQTVQQIDCDADWMGQMKLFLDEGWKLVDICIDTTALAEAFGMKAASRRIDSIWIFEKMKRSMEDTTAKFEGVILEYLHKTEKAGEFPCRDWRPVIAGMGVSGWELCTIVQTPFLVQSTFTTFTMKLLMFFQRPIFKNHQEQTEETLKRMVNKPVLKYNRYGVSKSLPRNFLAATRSGAVSKGYYNQMLKRFVYDDDEADAGDGVRTATAEYQRSVSSPTDSVTTRSSSFDAFMHSPSVEGSSSQISGTSKSVSLNSPSLGSNSGVSSIKKASLGSYSSTDLSSLPSLQLSSSSPESLSRPPYSNVNPQIHSPKIVVSANQSQSVPASPVSVHRGPNLHHGVPYIQVEQPEPEVTVLTPHNQAPNLSSGMRYPNPCHQPQEVPTPVSQTLLNNTQAFPPSSHLQHPRVPQASQNRHYTHGSPEAHSIPSRPLGGWPYQTSTPEIHPEEHYAKFPTSMNDIFSGPPFPVFPYNLPLPQNVPSSPQSAPVQAPGSSPVNIRWPYSASAPSTPLLHNMPFQHQIPAQSHDPIHPSSSYHGVQPQPIHPPILSSTPPGPSAAPAHPIPPPVPQRRSSLSAMPPRVPHRPPQPRRPRLHLPMANGYVPTGSGGTTYIRPTYSNRAYHSGVR